jgi:hypothetical protein
MGMHVLEPTGRAILQPLAGFALAVFALVCAIPPGVEVTRTARAETARTPMEIVKEDYRGWPNTYRLSNGLIEARVLTDVGPRIIDVRPAGGANLFHIRETPGGKHEQTYMFRGGWRLWIAPERTETTYALDNGECAVDIRDGTTLLVTAPPQPAAGIQKRIEVAPAAGEPRLRVISRIRNVAERPLTYAAWSLPVLQPGGRAFVPLDVGSLTAFDATRRLILWSYARFNDPRYQFGDRLIQIDHTRVTAPPAGESGRRPDESKVGADSAQGWAGYLLNGTLFLERFPYVPGGSYPDGGATIEVYSNHEFLELEHLGPLTTVQPGEEIVLPEDWWLFTGVSVPTSESDALATLQQYVAKTATQW